MIFIIFIIIVLFILLNNNIYERYLNPLQDLQKICKEKGLEPSYMPQVCYKSDGTFDPYSNCECVDKTGMCATCYKPLTKFELNAGEIYDSS